MSTTTSPSTEPIKTLDLVSAKASDIVNVNLYPECAEITRLYQFAVQKGQNLVTIRELPWAMEMGSLRVKCHPELTKINNVTVDKMLGFSPQKPSGLVTAQRKKDIADKQLERVKKTSLNLDSYAGSFKAPDFDFHTFEDVLKQIRSSGEKLDKEILRLEDELRNLDEELLSELHKHEATSHGQTPLKATISMLVEEDDDIEMKLVYTVNHAKWTPTYDIHDWSHVPLTLRTTSPSIEVDLPILESWPLSLSLPEPQSPPKNRKRRRESSSGTPARKSGTYDKRNAAYEEDDSEEIEGIILGAESGRLVEANAIENEDGNIETLVFPEGNVSATFKVPGGVTITSDNAVHQTLIADLKLEAKLSWNSIPKGDPNALVKAQLRNKSEYSLLPSTANVYVNGALHSKSEVPVVPPMGTFECSLGLDPSVRITYHPAIKNTATTGFYNRSRCHSHIQRITVHNMKQLPIKNLKIFDHIPVSENPQVTVKLISPPLKLPGPAVEFGREKAIPSVKISEGIAVQWAESDEVAADARNLGKDGKICWLCDIPSQGEVELVLQWEVLTPPDAQIIGLY
ncbi:hypothetical protein L218DRAFT_1003125 [Marasmius fiardii PR-910]|nr:hypothetical protein L218DRAFT_1003125 [Marasmius fiardii PR-910]